MRYGDGYPAIASTLMVSDNESLPDTVRHSDNDALSAFEAAFLAKSWTQPRLNMGRPGLCDAVVSCCRK
jgi:hypothetical protein